ncbi:hypothetical protein ES707_10130 [subsurface metagenome]
MSKLCHKRSTPEEKRTWYQAVLYTLPDAALLVKNGRCIDGNAAAEKLFGVAGREEILGPEISWFSPPRQPDGRESGEAIHARILDAMHGGPQKFAWQCRRADGTDFDAEVTLVAVRTDDSDVILVSVRDTCRGKRLPAGARAAEWKAEMVTRRNPLSIVTWSPEMNIRAVDKAFLQMTGRERGIVESMNLRDFESLDPTARNIADAVRKRDTVVEEVTLDLPAGSRTLIRSSTPLVDKEGNVIEILTVYRDVTP